MVDFITPNMEVSRPNPVFPIIISAFCLRFLIYLTPLIPLSFKRRGGKSFLERGRSPLSYV